MGGNLQHDIATFGRGGAAARDLPGALAGRAARAARAPPGPRPPPGARGGRGDHAAPTPSSHGEPLQGMGLAAWNGGPALVWTRRRAGSLRRGLAGGQAWGGFHPAGGVTHSHSGLTETVCFVRRIASGIYRGRVGVAVRPPVEVLAPGELVAARVVADQGPAVRGEHGARPAVQQHQRRDALRRRREGASGAHGAGRCVKARGTSWESVGTQLIVS
jgi:hypothetical protein